ncbi:hypothetical protein VA596_25075 [Amycolatopsis sp., V23-08]|uniref:Uncharacterized protein n=1 Tax=Amycolatopsis heterodermiae TaxID=3110235 RepID=A0ABU5R9D1_9PSEU|nr:hypothetical protein [Amycolatopsis sp., V23-08]MEA5362831.1 hypothetical protein [Amycolatopsis sp., V23-08]
MTERRARRVEVAAQPRHVSLGDAPGDDTAEQAPAEKAEEFEYLGILVERKHDGAPAGETWLPMGDDPSEEDDERLIAALHEAWLWTTEADRVSGTSW